MRGDMKLPAGFRFHPTDEELVVHYLCPKCASQTISVPIIADVDLYKFDPWLLPGMALYGEKEWYFFSPRDRKYPNGSRPNRAAGTGYWKATGADKPIGKPKTVGIKKALVFYAGKPPKGIKTNWIMHEYRLANVDRSPANKTNLRLDDWVLCRIYNKKGNKLDHNHMVLSMLQNNSEHFHDHKHVITPPDHNSTLQCLLRNDQLQVDTSESDPQCYTDTSGSIQVASPEFMCDREVHNEPKSNGTSMSMGFNHETYPFSYMEPFSTDLFAPSMVHDHTTNFQDLLMFLR